MIRYLTMLISALLLTSFVHGQEANSKKWNFTVAPYYYGPMINGKLTIRGHESDFSKNFSPAGMFEFKAYSSKWGIITDFVGFNFDYDFTAPATNRAGTVEFNSIFWGVYATHRVTKWLDLGIGGRLSIYKSSLKLGNSSSYSPVEEEVQYWLLPPLIIYRFSFFTNEKWEVRLRGDVGGYGFFDTYTYLLEPFVSYQFTKLLGGYIGYRVQSIIHDDKEKNDKIDLLFHGVKIGLLFRF